jgi:hypothetical protein
MRAKGEKDWVLIALALAGVFFHISYMWYTAIKSGSGVGVADSNILFPMYSCNLCTYLLFSLLLIPKGKVWNTVAAMVAYAGTVGGLVTVVDYLFAGVADWMDFEFVKSFFSHAALLGGGVWLFVRYVRIGPKNFLACFCYIILCAIDALTLCLLLPNANPMWTREPIIKGVDFLKGWNIGWLFLVGVLAFLVVFDLIKYKGDLKAAWKNQMGAKNFFARRQN